MVAASLIRVSCIWFVMKHVFPLYLTWNDVHTKESLNPIIKLLSPDPSHPKSSPFCWNSSEVLNLNEKSRKKCQRIVSTDKISIKRNEGKCLLKKYTKLGTAEEINQTLFFGCWGLDQDMWSRPSSSYGSGVAVSFDSRCWSGCAWAFPLESD